MTTVPPTPQDLRALNPYFCDASRRWRAGKPLRVVRAAFPHLQRVLFGPLPGTPANQRLLDLVASIRAYDKAPPGWDFPERPKQPGFLGLDLSLVDDPPVTDEQWIWEYADDEDKPRNWAGTGEGRFFKHDMREHQRAEMGSPGRPCIHHGITDRTDGSLICEHCGLQMRKPKISTDQLVHDLLGYRP